MHLFSRHGTHTSHGTKTATIPPHRHSSVTSTPPCSFASSSRAVKQSAPHNEPQRVLKPARHKKRDGQRDADNNDALEGDARPFLSTGPEIGQLEHGTEGCPLCCTRAPGAMALGPGTSATGTVRGVLFVRLSEDLLNVLAELRFDVDLGVKGHAVAAANIHLELVEVEILAKQPQLRLRVAHDELDLFVRHGIDEGRDRRPRRAEDPGGVQQIGHAEALGVVALQNVQREPRRLHGRRVRQRVVEVVHDERELLHARSCGALHGAGALHVVDEVDNVPVVVIGILVPRLHVEDDAAALVEAARVGLARRVLPAELPLELDRDVAHLVLAPEVERIFQHLLGRIDVIVPRAQIAQQARRVEREVLVRGHVRESLLQRPKREHLSAARPRRQLRARALGACCGHSCWGSGGGRGRERAAAGGDEGGRERGVGGVASFPNWESTILDPASPASSHEKACRRG
mmetsp:Transcript_17523/g.53642  ORF Transcript_17523/g.53642 Transcript_17523/m.53642 type:complete len:460 (-) Transcript_17523:87-1466(-)